MSKVSPRARRSSEKRVKYQINSISFLSSDNSAIDSELFNILSIDSHVVGKKYFNVSTGLPLTSARTRPATIGRTFDDKHTPAMKFKTFSLTI